MLIYVNPRGAKINRKDANCILLIEDSWNDYFYFTMFSLVYVDEDNLSHDLGRVKIGFKGQTQDQKTISALESTLEALDERFFSVGEDIEFYKNISSLGKNVSSKILTSMRDVVYNHEIIENNRKEDVFSVSLLRNFSVSVLKGQLSRVLRCRVPDDQISQRSYPLLASRELIKQFIQERLHGHQAA